jgi:diguanylate cyclase (GGDEF)-like protein
VGDCYEAVRHSAAAAVGAETCDLALYEAETRSLIARRPRYAAPGQPVPRFRFPLDAAPASAHVVSTGRAYVCNDPAADPLYRPSARDQGVASVLTVPVQLSGRTLGLLYAVNKPGGFLEEDVRVLTALAGAAAVTLENVRIYSEERERRVLNESLQEMSRALVGSPSEDPALATVLDQMWRVIPYRVAAAVLRHGESFRVAACRGGPAGRVGPIGATSELGAILEGRPLLTPTDASQLEAELGLPAVPAKALAHPLVAKGEVLGALVVVFETAHLPGPREGQLLAAFGDHAALFLEAGAVLRRERQARARAAVVARVTRMAAEKAETESLLAEIAPGVLAASGADRIVFYLAGYASDELLPVAQAGAHGHEHERVKAFKPDPRMLRALVETREVAIYDTPGVLAGLSPFPAASCVVVAPLSWREEVLGAVMLARLGGAGKAEAALVDFLRDLAQQLALAVLNTRLLSSLSRMAATDELTQLANRRRFTEALRVEISRARRSGAPLALVLGDLDQLKRINDTHGHPAGDAAIRHAAEAFRRGRRETDLAARLGGEEFVLLLPSADVAGAVSAAERIRQDLASSTVPGIGTVTVSLGVATFPEDGSCEEDLIRAADERLYAAKAGGRNQVCAPGVLPRPAAS